ncbi:Xanthine and CO dehydrogenase maturation factor, XdhC/CoxF family [Reichenbachiella agariperforans]|uniref:Xanthine and CO dehydrogenase maturation factor, XdhC/CoxF family n=1 Tax=Reichenbachiella agariperforans TaxID=156994 RepID=A0A1M6PWJ9_REIAG|nr:XdhC/CoxI family protein [Reichenbachiella agariperforans]SHK12364.1 Xanthine and CO dehydrogenase maturation factor, XdhC/CoxF family [Reichenbachiella agariperforans]
MFFELKQIIQHAVTCQSASVKCVLATVVGLDGSSYRKPGVRMLITEHCETVGAVSGGCVEKEVMRQAQAVFRDDVACVMTYDGRYRLGCEGVLFILIEPILLSHKFLRIWSDILDSRLPVSLVSQYQKEVSQSPQYGTYLRYNDENVPLSTSFDFSESYQIFQETLTPPLRLVIVGTEHDAVHMARLASDSGMEVIVVSSVKDPRVPNDFLGASAVVALEPDDIQSLGLDDQTAIILMTHSYSRDFQYALNLLQTEYCYFGIIGSHKRKNMLLDELLQYNEELDIDKLEHVHSPAGLDIGAVTPQEIALSVIAEIISLVRQRDVLRESVHVNMIQKG